MAAVYMKPSRESEEAPKHILSESKKQNSFLSRNATFTVQKQAASSGTPSQDNTHLSQALHRTVSQASSATSDSNRMGFPAGRYNSPTDSLISPISRGLLRRGKRTVGSLHEFVPPKVLETSYETENLDDKSTRIV